MQYEKKQPQSSALPDRDFIKENRIKDSSQNSNNFYVS